MFALIRGEDALGIASAGTFFYLVLVFLVVWLARSTELRLLMLGILTAAMAAWYGRLAASSDVGVQVSAGGTGARVAFGGADMADILGRIAFLLVLGSIAITILMLSRRSVAVAPASREEAIRERPT